MMAELGEEVSNAGIARRYAGLVDVLVLDESDAAEAPAVEALGIAAHAAPTVMTTDADKTALARGGAGARVADPATERAVTVELPHPLRTIVPMKPLAEAKTRLWDDLPPLERHAVVLLMLERVAAAAVGATAQGACVRRGRR